MGIYLFKINTTFRGYQCKGVFICWNNQQNSIDLPEMKKAFFILILLAAINFTAPNTQAFGQSLRHRIEFVQEDKAKDLTDSEILEKKVAMYMKMRVLLVRVTMVDNGVGFNTSWYKKAKVKRQKMKNKSEKKKSKR